MKEHDSVLNSNFQSKKKIHCMPGYFNFFLPFSYSQLNCCQFWSLANYKQPQILQQRLYKRPDTKIHQIPSIFQCKYHLPSKSPTEQKKRKKNQIYQEDKKKLLLFFLAKYIKLNYSSIGNIIISLTGQVVNGKLFFFK